MLKRAFPGRRFVRDERGATAIEYGLIAALIAVALIGSIAATGDVIGGNWDSTVGQITDALN